MWEHSVRGSGIGRDGCSLHIDEAARTGYLVGSYYGRSDEAVPAEYSRAVGMPVEAYVDDALFDRLSRLGTVRLPESSLSNLMNMDEIILKQI